MKRSILELVWKAEEREGTRREEGGKKSINCFWRPKLTSY